MGGMLVRMLQGGGGSPMGMPGAAPSAQANPMAGDQYAQQVSQLKGADPGGLLAQVKAVKQIFAIMYVQNMERLPNVSSKILATLKTIDPIIKEIQQASNVNAAVRNPIQMSAAQPSPEGASPAMQGGF